MVLKGISLDCPEANSSAAAPSQKEKVLLQRPNVSTNGFQKAMAERKKANHKDSVKFSAVIYPLSDFAFCGLVGFFKQRTVTWDKGVIKTAPKCITTSAIHTSHSFKTKFSVSLPELPSKDF